MLYVCVCIGLSLQQRSLVQSHVTRHGGLYYLARLLKAGEDVNYIARRLVILASEDVGNADPQGLVIATSAQQACHLVGMPEAGIILAQAVTYLSTAPKSNRSYSAYNLAMEDVEKFGSLEVPNPIKNAPTQLMKNLGYGKNYKYAHSFDNSFVNQEFLPEAITNTTLYEPGNNNRENAFREYLKTLWKNKYNY